MRVDIQRTKKNDYVEKVTAEVEVTIGATPMTVSASALVPTGRRVRGRLHEARNYADPYVQVSIVDERDRELARARAYVGTEAMISVRTMAIESAAKALAVLLDRDETTVDVTVGGEIVTVSVARDLVSR